MNAVGLRYNPDPPHDDLADLEEAVFYALVRNVAFRAEAIGEWSARIAAASLHGTANDLKRVLEAAVEAYADSRISDTLHKAYAHQQAKALIRLRDMWDAEEWTLRRSHLAAEMVLPANQQDEE